MSRSAADLSLKFDRLGKGIEKRQKEAARAGAVVIDREVTRRLKAATGGDLVLSGMTRTTGGKRSGSKRPMRVKIGPARQSDGVFVSITGPAQLVENDVAKHIVVSRHAKGAGYTKVNAKGNTVKGRATRQSRQASVAFGLGAAGGGRRAVLHWGNNWARYTTASSKGRHPWRNGVRAARPKAAREMARVESGALTEVFK